MEMGVGEEGGLGEIGSAFHGVNISRGKRSKVRGWRSVGR